MLTDLLLTKFTGKLSFSQRCDYKKVGVAEIAFIVESQVQGQKVGCYGCHFARTFHVLIGILQFMVKITSVSHERRRVTTHGLTCNYYDLQLWGAAALKAWNAIQDGDSNKTETPDKPADLDGMRVGKEPRDEIEIGVRWNLPNCEFMTEK